jgi:hypothetical protein
LAENQTKKPQGYENKFSPYLPPALWPAEFRWKPKLIGSPILGRWPDVVSAGYGLNGAGQAAGTSSNPSAAIDTLFSNGQAIGLGTLEANDVSVATAINGSAEVVGYEFFGSLPCNLSHAWLHSNGQLTDLHSPPLGRSARIS